MFDAVNTTVEMLAVGLGLPANTFKEKLVGGASKLAPNANDLRRCKKGEPFSGIHYDFSLMSIHGKCRYPGLFIWLPNGEKIKISIPRGYLLLQAGNELEYLTGGYIKCGYHEAVNTPEVE
jgi:isopenicillin N synthase-like dioxygenase